MLLLTTITALAIASAPTMAVSGTKQNHHEPPPFPPPWTRRPLIQIAIVLDTGSRMAGLIHQAKTEIWAIANEMIFKTKDGKTPVVQLAVLSDNTLWKHRGYADGQVFVPFTMNYYAIFKRLDKQQRRNGTDTDRADAVRIALHRLEWSPYPEDFKAIFVVGDGYFTRSKGALASACEQAADAGVIINTLFCGHYKFGINKRWSEPAYATGGQYIGIDHVQRLRYKETPIDKTILALNDRLNETFRLDADRLSALWKQQRDMDRDLAIVSKEARMHRIVTKAAKGLLFDRTDALLNEETSAWGLEPQIPPGQIPPPKTERELTQLSDKESRRRLIQQEILRLAEQRPLHLSSHNSTARRPSLGRAVIKILREQTTAKGFYFKSPTASTQPDQPE